jgi:hypothetical protein
MSECRTDLHPYVLAGLAETACPDSPTSPGAEWLRLVANAAQECTERCLDEDEELSDAVHEIADSLVPIYTHERWATFVDLAAYNVDLDDYSPSEDMSERAGLALYVVAERLLNSLLNGEGT